MIGDYMAGGRAAELVTLNEPMGEDCLVLNVLTPKADGARRPVLVYLHGGGFFAGSGAVHTLGDRFVAEEDVVLVTVNHRLGPFGFAYLGGLISECQVGNPGMLDLVQALEWVRDNIAGFGGEPANVTIFGESGGGGKVALLMAMPQAAGLFHRAIIESAGPVSPPEPSGSTESIRAALASANIDSTSLSALQSMPASELLALLGELAAWPVADGHTLTSAMWDPGPPVISAGIPLIVGYCRDETSLFSAESTELFALPDFPAVLSALSDTVKCPAAFFEGPLAAYREVYPTDTPSQIHWRMATMTGWLGRGAVRVAALKSQQPAPVYHYRIEYDTRLGPGIGAFHTCELPLANRMVLQPRAESLSRNIAGAWAAFARRGDPNHAGLPTWRQLESGGGEIMIFDVESWSGRDPETAAKATLEDALVAAGLSLQRRP